jgi:hypothetical protein
MYENSILDQQKQCNGSSNDHIPVFIYRMTYTDQIIIHRFKDPKSDHSNWDDTTFIFLLRSITA